MPTINKGLINKWACIEVLKTLNNMSTVLLFTTKREGLTQGMWINHSQIIMNNKCSYHIYHKYTCTCICLHIFHDWWTLEKVTTWCHLLPKFKFARHAKGYGRKYSFTPLSISFYRWKEPECLGFSKDLSWDTDIWMPTWLVDNKGSSVIVNMWDQGTSQTSSHEWNPRFTYLTGSYWSTVVMTTGPLCLALKVQNTEVYGYVMLKNQA